MYCLFVFFLKVIVKKIATDECAVEEKNNKYSELLHLEDKRRNSFNEYLYSF